MKLLFRFLVFRIMFYAVLVTSTTMAQTTVDETISKGKASVDAKLAVVATPTPEVSQTMTPRESLRSAKFIYVHSESVLVGQSVIETKLRKRPEFQQLGLMITRDRAAADLILEVRHDVLTKYVFTAIDPATKVVVASGKLSSLGGTVAGKVAERFMKQLLRAR